ncbi:LOG family protein [Patescibacteria group bacterium]|nr:LOG family protein [Patescibacteria group bacterium]
MPQLDRFEKIVLEETQQAGLPPEIQERALEILHSWLDTSEEHRGEICKHVRELIRTEIDKSLRGAARKALTRANERIATEAISDAHVEKRNRQSASRMKEETLRGYELIRRQGKGFVFFGTARSKSGETEYERARELSREVSLIFGSTIWGGAGPGDMDATARGAQEAGGRIGGIKIHLTEEQSKFEQDISTAYSEDEVMECDYFATRKILLVEAAMPESEDDRTGIICLPGGWGSGDEFFEFGNLKILKKLGTQRSVPVVLMNYNGEYDGILAFIDRAISDGRISDDQGVIRPDDPEQKGVLRVCTSNAEALEYLADYYGVPEEDRHFAERLRNWEVEPDNIPEGTGAPQRGKSL